MPSTEIRVLVCGGRDFRDQTAVTEFLRKLHTERKIACIIHGGARGADMLAGQAAKVLNIPYQVFAADWARYGNAAGPIRNKRMLVEGCPDLVVAFPGGKGTANMIMQAQAAGIEVVRV